MCALSFVFVTKWCAHLQLKTKYRNNDVVDVDTLAVDGGGIGGVDDGCSSGGGKGASKTPDDSIQMSYDTGLFNYDAQRQHLSTAQHRIIQQLKY